MSKIIIGVYAPDISSLSGSAKRIHDLEIISHDTSHCGEGLDWSSYTVYDCGSCLLRYLKLLPEPVLPVDYYNSFIAAVNVDDSPGSIRSLQELTASTPPPPPPTPRRHLLLYLVDLLAIFSSHSRRNQMTPARLISTFSPHCSVEDITRCQPMTTPGQLRTWDDGSYA